MDYKLKTLSKSEVELTITVTKEEMETFRKKACDEISKEIKVKGFRPGHVPMHILEQYVDKKYITAHTQEMAIQRTYADAAIKEKLQVVSRPKVKIEEDEPFKFTAKVAIMPEVQIKDHKSIKIDKKEVKVTEKDIEAVLEDMKKYGTLYKDTDRAAKKGDRVEVDFEGFDDKDQPVPSTKSANHPVIIGDESLIPGFEDELVGLKKGEKKEFNLKFPKDYHKKDFQEKKLKFKVEIKKVEEPQIPELTDELIEKMTGKKQSIADFKKEIEKDIKARKDSQEKQRRENEYLEELLKKTDLELPEALVDEESEQILLEMKDDVSQKGLNFDDFLTRAKTTEDDLRKRYRKEAEKRLKIRLALQHVIKEEGIKVSVEEVDKELAKVKSFYPEEQHKKIQEDYDKGELKNQIFSRLVLRKLFEKVLA